MISREDILRELELLPAWRLRHAPKAVPENSAAEMNAEKIALMQVPTISEAHAGSESSTQEAAATQVELSVESTLPLIEAPPLPDRAEMIQQMDWQALQDCIKDCQACGLATNRTQTVFGMGDPDAEWLIVGEAPGAEEDASGVPFAGQAGKLLDNMLAALQLRRGQNVYLANVLKCRSPESRNAQQEELIQCELYLKQQVALIKPKLIIALGDVAARSILQSDKPMAEMRGKVHHYHGVPVIVTYHPTDLLSRPEDKPKAWEDLCFARKNMQNLSVS